MSEERIVALEELTAHQAKAIDELSDEIARQSRMIATLERRLETLSQRFLAIEEVAAPAPESKRPPHW